MFTGLIEAVGEHRGVERTAAGITSASWRRRLATELTLGDSLAVNGVCLTVVARGRTDDARPTSRRKRRASRRWATLERGALGQSRTAAAGRRAARRPLRPGACGRRSRPSRPCVQEGESYWLTVRVSRRCCAPYIVREGLHRGGRHQPDRRGAGERPVRRADHPVHVDAHDVRRASAGNDGQPRVRYPREVRRSRCARAAADARRRTRPRASQDHRMPDQRRRRKRQIALRADRGRRRRRSATAR